MGTSGHMHGDAWHTGLGKVKAQSPRGTSLTPTRAGDARGAGDPGGAGDTRGAGDAWGAGVARGAGVAQVRLCLPPSRTFLRAHPSPPKLVNVNDTRMNTVLDRSVTICLD